MNYWLLIIPFAGAFIGWLIAGISLRFLFYPRSPKKILGFTYLGIIPAQRQKLTDAVASFAGGLVSSKSITDKINEPGSLTKVMPVIEDHMDDFLRNRLKKEMPMIGMLIGDKTINTLKATFMTEIENLLPLVIDKFVENISSGNSIPLLISQKLNAIPAADIEKALVPGLAPVWTRVRVVGALIGFITGLVQLLILYLLIRSIP